MELEHSFAIPCDDGGDHPVLAVGPLSISDEHVSVALTDASLHVFSVRKRTHELKVAEPSSQIISSHLVVGDQVFVGSPDGVLRIWSLANGLLLSELPPVVVEAESIAPQSASRRRRDPAGICALFPLPVQIASDRPSVLVATVGGSIHLWTTNSRSYLRSFQGGHSGVIFSIQSYMNGERFISAARDGTCAAWCLKTAAMLWKNTQDCQVYSSAVGSGRVLLGRRDGSITVLRLEDGAQMIMFNAHEGLINGIVSSDHLFVSTSVDGFAKVWSIHPLDTTPKLERSERLYDHAITSRCIFGPWLVTAGKHGGGEANVCGLDHRMKIWRIQGEIVAAEEVGLPALVIWTTTSLKSSTAVAVSLMKRGRPTLEIWRKA